MLWTDEDFITAADLASIDPDIAEATDAQGITLSGSTGSIRRGVEDAARFLAGMLVSFATYISSNDLSSNHLGAVFYTGSQPNQRQRITLDQVVVSGRNADYWSDLKQWAVNRVLVQAYLAASNRAENDRYEAKYETFLKLDQLKHWPQFKQTGCPLVYRPIAAPGATGSTKPGSWTAALASVSGNIATGGHDVAITYVDQSKYIDATRPGNAESGPSARKTVTLTTDHGITVDITRLNPPNGSVPPELLARGFTVPGNASGWNVYVGVTGGTLYLQNATPIDIATKTYTLAADPTSTGAEAGIGQYPDQFMSFQDLIQRG